MNMPPNVTVRLVMWEAHDGKDVIRDVSEHINLTTLKASAKMFLSDANASRRALEVNADLDIIGPKGMQAELVNAIPAGCRTMQPAFILSGTTNPVALEKFWELLVESLNEMYAAKAKN